MSQFLDVGIYKKHCFFTVDLEIQQSIFKCNTYEQRFIRIANLSDYLSKNRCTMHFPEIIYNSKGIK